MQGELSEEVLSLTERYEQNPGSRLFAPLADLHRKSGNIDRAIELCEDGLERYPDYASAHVILGKCFYDKGATERARAEFLRVLELDPENMVALKFMGDILLAEDKSNEATEYFKRLLTIDPMNEEAEHLLGEIERKFEAREIDLGDRKRVTKVEQPRELATMTLAGIYAAQGYYNKALKIYREILEKEPSNTEASEMIDKLRAIMEKTDKERDESFKDEAMTISLEDVSDELAESTVGEGGIAEGEGRRGGATEDEEAVAEAPRAEANGEEEQEAEPAEEREAATVAQEIDEEDERQANIQRKRRIKEKGMRKGQVEEDEKNIESFQSWLKKMKGEGDD